MSTDPDQFCELARLSEKLGFYGIAVGDHIVMPSEVHSRYPYSKNGKAGFGGGKGLDVFVTLSFLAGVTSKIKLVTSILVVPYRNPLLVAKMGATIDILSKGRLILGTGAGWAKEEFEILHAPPFDERGKVCDEYIQILKEVWTNTPSSFHGKYFDFDDLEFLRPIQQPHPPIWVGGESDNALLRAVKLGDGWYPTINNPLAPLREVAVLKNYVSRIKELATKTNRARPLIGLADISYNPEINSSELLFTGPVAKLRSDIRVCEKLGVDYLSFNLRADQFSESTGKLKWFADEVISNQQ